MREVRYCEVAHFHFISLSLQNDFQATLPSPPTITKQSIKKPGTNRAFALDMR